MKCKIGFVSLGCPKNLTDTETMIGLLQDDCEIVQDPAQAQIIVVNTCGFIESAKQESIDTILEMAQYKTKGNLQKLVVTGCLAQRYSKEILEQMGEVDAIVGTGSYGEIKEVVQAVLEGQRPVVMADINAPVPEGLPRRLATPQYTAYLKIADGCDNHCTYCIIPKLRGKYRSRRLEDIVKEARDLAAQGVTEVILIAQDTSRYGMDLYGRLMLPQLLRQLEKIEEIVWIRIHYCYPEMVTDEFIEEMARNPKVCHYIDIPFQHASDHVLQRMARRVKNEENRALVRRLREKIPDITIRSTFITGFPGETTEDFAQLKAFVQDMEFDRVGVFAFSEEEGTPAEKMDGKVPEEVKQARKNEVMQLQQKISLDKNRKKIGKTVQVLCEGSESSGRYYIGRTAGDSPEIDCCVLFEGKPTKPGEYVMVQIQQAKEYELLGIRMD